MKLFEDKKRAYSGPKERDESTFQFLDRSNRPEIEEVRDFLERAFKRFPRQGKADIKGRLSSRNEANFDSAFFELYLHEILSELGFKCKLHPQGSSKKGTRPDFLVKKRGERPFFLEAVVVTGIDKEKQAENARKEVVYKSIEKINSPNFFLGLRIKGALPESPKTRDLRKKLEKWLSLLDPGKLNFDENEQSLDRFPKFHYETHGWNVEFFAIPKKSSSRGKSGVRPIGITFPEAQFLNTAGDLKRALSKKAKKYGRLRKGYLIAVNSLGMGSDDLDFFNAVFGSEEYRVKKQGTNVEVRQERAKDGVLYGEKGIQNSAISGFLFSHGLTISNYKRKNCFLSKNLWANFPYQGSLEKLPQKNLTEKGFERKSGVLPTHIFKNKSSGRFRKFLGTIKQKVLNFIRKN